jgi:hypothetical protein
MMTNGVLFRAILKSRLPILHAAHMNRRHALFDAADLLDFARLQHVLMKALSLEMEQTLNQKQ